MEFLFSQLKKMDAVSIVDGKNLGRVCDLAFFFPECKLKGIFVTGCRGFKFSREDLFIPVSDIVRIGEDVVLVRYGEQPPAPPPCPPQSHCPPQSPCPPQSHCPPQGNRPPCPPQSPCPPNYPRPDPRRNFDDYE